MPALNTASRVVRAQSYLEKQGRHEGANGQAGSASKVPDRGQAAHLASKQLTP